MGKKSSFFEYINSDLLGNIAGITTKRMFGGYRFYLNGVIFGMIIQDKLYFKTGKENRKEYESRGSKPFSYAKKGKEIVLTSYWELPEEIMENRDELREWIDKAALVNKP